MSRDRIRARTAARKAAGENQTYPEHAGKAAHAGAGARTSLPLLKAAPCHYEGEILTPCRSCGSDLRHVRDCELHGSCTRVDAQKDVDRVCATCPQYTAPERKGDPRCGVAIGSYRWSELVELQIRLVRATCGPVPILISNDHPESAAALARICAAHPDVSLFTNPENLGHVAGDLAAYRRGVEMGAARGLAVVAKLSQRLLISRPYWLQDGARDLLASGLATSTRAATGLKGGERFPIRTEFALMRVEAWNRPAVLERIGERRYWHGRPGGYPGEQVVHDLVRDELGGTYWPAALLPTNREQVTAGILWHDADQRSAYDALAKQLGVVLPPDFHTGGWDREFAAGTYLYG